MPNILSILNDPSSPYSSADEPTPIEQKVASGTIYRVTDSTVAVLADGYFYDDVTWDTSNTIPVVGVDCVLGFDQNNVPYLLQWQGMGTQASLAAGGDASGTLNDLTVNTVEGGKTPLTTVSTVAGSHVDFTSVPAGTIPAAAVAGRPQGNWTSVQLTGSVAAASGVTGITAGAQLTTGSTAEIWCLQASAYFAANSANWTLIQAGIYVYQGFPGTVIGSTLFPCSSGYSGVTYGTGSYTTFFSFSSPNTLYQIQLVGNCLGSFGGSWIVPSNIAGFRVA